MIAPVLAGSCLIEGSKLQVRRQRGETTVEAPRRFLKALYQWCDGSRTLDEIEGIALERWGPSRFGAFLRSMLDAGVLIDASQAVREALDGAQLPTTLGRAAPGEVWQPHVGPRSAEPLSSDIALVPPAGSALGQLLQSRRSTRYFCGAPLGDAAIAALLQAMYGIVPASGNQPARRVVASAGAFYPLRAHLLMLRAAGGIAPGVFEALYGSDGGIALRRIGDLEQGDAFRALVAPHRAAHATGLVVLSADTTAAALKYRGRAMQFALIEAGAALHGGGLVAAERGLGWCVIGGYDWQRVATLCQLGGADRVLGCALFGAPAQPSGTRAGRRDLELAWVENLDGSDRHVMRANVVAPRSGTSVSWGRHADAATACAIAISEAVERYAYRTLPAAVRAGTARAVAGIDPRSLVQYADLQYREGSAGVHPFNPDREYLWATAIDQATGGEVPVPVDCVSHPACIPEPFARGLLMRATSSGCASDVSIEVATQRAALELIERDALARHWLAQAPGRAITAESLPARLRQRIAELGQLGCQADVSVLTMGLSPVFCVAVSSPVRGFCTVGTAAGLESEDTLERAFTEAEVTAHLRLQHERPPKVSAREARTPTDHGNLYAQRRYWRRAAAITVASASEDLAKVEALWPRTLAAQLRRADGSPARLLAVELTVGDEPLSFEGQPIRTVRALIPGLIPIAFGYDALPRAMAPRAAPGARFPHPLP